METMTDLSSAAQAVWRAHEQVLGDECVLTKTDMKALAAAFRAAADQWKNEICKQLNTEFISGIKNCIDALNELADELEDVKYGTYRSALSDKPK